ncbi:MAG: hypothetical protein Q9160_008777 [Pyrenula sp. 1 TL-2023]
MEAPLTQNAVKAKAQDGRKRAFHSKVRSGCLTCKNRRVKCDEKRPTCQRCLSSGRKCEGYGNPLVFVLLEGANQERTYSTAPKAAKILDTPSTLVLGLFKDEYARRSVQFFQERTIITLARGVSGGDFWGGALLQAAHSKSPVAHLVVALSSVHESFDRPGDGKLRIQALQHCSVAASRLAKEKIVGTDTILLSCLLFIAYEYFQGDVKQSLVHISNGMNIIEAWNEGQCPDQKNGTVTKESTRLVNDRIAPIFKFMNNVFGALIAKREPTPEQEAPPAKTFASPNEAMDKMDEIYHAIGGLRNDSLPAGTNSNTSMSRDVERLMAEWDAGTGGDFWTADPQGIKNRKLLQFRIHRRVVALLLKVLASGRDNFDETHNNEFDEILKLYEDAMPQGHEVRAIENNFLHFELGLIPPLFLTATRCKEPLIRRRAVDLLHSVRRTENLWDSCWAAQIAKDVLLWEETSLTPQKPENLSDRMRMRIFDLDFLKDPLRAELSFHPLFSPEAAQKWTYGLEATRQNAVTSSHERAPVDNVFLRTFAFQGVVLTQPNVCHCDSSARATFNLLHEGVRAWTRKS